MSEVEKKNYDADGVEISAKEELLYVEDIRLGEIYGHFIFRAKVLGYSEWWIGEQLADIAYGYLEAYGEKQREAEEERKLEEEAKE